MLLLVKRSATTQIHTLSLHDALPIFILDDQNAHPTTVPHPVTATAWRPGSVPQVSDRKSTRLNSSHRCISYAVFCLKKKRKYMPIMQQPSMMPRHTR